MCEGPLRLGPASPQRLTKPLIRIAESYPKGPLSSDVKADGGQGRSDKRGRKPGGLVPYEEVMPHREASWEEALDLVARRLGRSTPRAAPTASLAGSAKCPTRAYLFQKLIRTGFRTNNVDHCTGCATRPVSRRCSRVSALARSRPPTATSRTPTSRSSPAATRPPTTRWLVVLQAGAAPRTKIIYIDARPAPSPSTPTSSANSNPAPMWRSTTGSCTR